MQGTKELDLLCWLGPAELVNFIKRQINVRKGWSALGDVALLSWLGLFFIWPLHPSNPNSTASGVTLAVPAQLVWVLAQRNSPQGCFRRKILSKGENMLWTPWPSLPAPTHLTLFPSALLHPTDTRDLPHNPPENSSFTPLWNLLHTFAFTALQIFSRPITDW